MAEEIHLPPPLPTLQSPDSKEAELGRILFFDRRLSGDGTLACASCHIPGEAFADGQPLSGAYPTRKHFRNTPSLINVAYLEVLFWDGRASSLEEQAMGPMQAPFEMNVHPDFLVAELRESPGYRALFREAFGEEPSRGTVAAALAAFQKTLRVTDSPFDRYLAGEKEALSKTARRGAEIFFGERGGCSRCHRGPLLSDGKFHNLGLPGTEAIRSDPRRRAALAFFLQQRGLPPLERDPGRYAVTRLPEDLGAFRTPPLRQVADTAPYMHDGSLATLEEVLEFHNRGGGHDPGKSPLLRPLSLTEGELGDLKVFLLSLSGNPPEVSLPNLPEESL